MEQEKIKRGQQTLDSDYSEFRATDPFNPQNHVEGRISFNRVVLRLVEDKKDQW